MPPDVLPVLEDMLYRQTRGAGGNLSPKAKFFLKGPKCRVQQSLQPGLRLKGFG